MRSDLVEAVVDSAKYLREVRPIDPEELVQYVSDDVTPGAIRTVLRDRLVELALRERPDGTFVPVSDAPFEVEFAGVEGFPSRHERAVLDLLRGTFGEHWHEGESGDTLREAIRRFKRAYFAGKSVEYDSVSTLGYAIYHAPATFATVQYVLDELGTARLLRPPLRLLDVGAGVGAGALAVDAYLPEACPVAYTAVEASDAAADVMEALLAGTGRNFRCRIDRTPIEDATVDGPFDIVLLANVLSELADPVGVLADLVPVLSDTGSIVGIAPADARTSRALRHVESETLRRVSGLDVFAPTLRLWPGRQPTDHCWSFDVRPDLSVPAFQRRIDEAPRRRPEGRPPGTGEFVNVDVQFSYSILRTDGTRRIDARPSPGRFLQLRETGDRITDRVNLAAVKLSPSLAEPDANPLFVIGDGSQQTEHFAVLARETRLNRHLLAAEYGDVLLVRDGLLLWNADQAAVNVVVDDETLVDRIAPGDVH